MVKDYNDWHRVMIFVFLFLAHSPKLWPAFEFALMCHFGEKIVTAACVHTENWMPMLD